MSTLVTGGLDASRAACQGDRRKRVKQVVNPLRQAATAFARAEGVGVGTEKWIRRMAKSENEKKIRRARSKLIRLQARLSPACVGRLGDTIAGRGHLARHAFAEAGDGSPEQAAQKGSVQ